ncbi:hypothetical protein HHK36_017559 [Tetracentron sinense]|uniref:Uncharacterized protein n=1 Tax=Tetracentron sinense TaxID=13715 RepID=A0A835DC05_TETSI|nr:hypothetical protein HHK36_017559 [Tetracentron sinense]
MPYSRAEFNVPEFIEYDPTPYDGGYDPARTYGKPLPPSVATCYPRSISDPNSPSLEGFSYRSVSSPYGKEEVDYTERPRNRSKAYEEEQVSNVGSGNWPNDPYDGYLGDDIFSRGYGAYDNDYGSGCGVPVDSYQGGGDVGKQPAYDYRPWPGYGYGYGREEDGFDYGKQVPQPPYGYHSGDTELCEGIFGYWPCLSQNVQRNYGQQDADEQSNGNQWCGTAEYLFGSSYPYGERSDEGNNYRDPYYGYERHYQGEPHCRQDEYNEPSWLEISNYHEAYQEDVYRLSKHKSISARHAKWMSFLQE